MLDEVQLESACHFSFVVNREVRFACSSSLEYLAWMKSVRQALELACASPHFDAQVGGSMGAETHMAAAAVVENGRGGYESYEQANAYGYAAAPVVPVPPIKGHDLRHSLPTPPSPSMRDYFLDQQGAVMMAAAVGGTTGHVDLMSGGDTSSIQQESELRTSRLYP
jgi:hypothetical protein